MNCCASFWSRAAAALGLSLLVGCASLPGPESPAPAVPGPPSADRPSPQTAGTTVRWVLSPPGGGEQRYEFTFRREGAMQAEEHVTERPSFDWVPRTPGTYRARGAVVDALGNRLEGAWSDPFEVRPRLRVVSLEASVAPPQPALTTLVEWKVETHGGVGDLTCDFHVAPEGGEVIVARGQPVRWFWSPSEPGNYRVRAVVRDAQGNQAESAWSLPYRVVPLTVAVFPFDNLGAGAAPLEALRDSFARALGQAGYRVLDSAAVERFLARHRIRHTGGLTAAAAKALFEEEGVGGVFVTSVESYAQGFPPRLALSSRLVGTGGTPRVVWTEGFGMAGDDTPGLLGLGLVRDPQKLADRAFEAFVESLGADLAGRSEAKDGGRPPGRAYRGPALGATGRTVAVVPFLNRSDRRYAGELVALQFAVELARLQRWTVVEPGLVRDQLLRFRIIMDEGVSWSNADALLAGVDADLIVSGVVGRYQEGDAGPPQVEFTVYALDRATETVAWHSESRGSGNDRVVAFEFGKIKTAHELSTVLVRGAVAQWARRAVSRSDATAASDPVSAP